MREIPKPYRFSLLKDFLNKSYIQNSVLLLGDSQTNGFGYTTEVIFSNLLSKKLNKKVINASFQDERIIDNINLLKYMKKQDMRFDTIIFNVNQSHIQAPNYQRVPINTHHYKVGILYNSKSFKDFSNKFNPIEDKNDTFYEYDSLPHYFDMPLQKFIMYIHHLKSFILLAKSISKQVIIYDTPHPIKEVQRLKLNIKNMNMLSTHTKNICAKYNVIFLKPNIINNNFFDDIVHFNKKGHIEMANILYNVIE